MVKNLPVLWDRNARDDLRNIISFINGDSAHEAQKIKREFLKIAENLSLFPEKYSAEPYLKEEPGNFRSVVRWNYKLIYEVTDKEIIIIMLFHTRQNPNKITRKLT